MSSEVEASPLFTPPEAVDALVTKIHNITEPADRIDALAGMEAGARFIVAAELERIAESLPNWNCGSPAYVDARNHAKQHLLIRASELRGEGKDGDG